MKVEIKNNEVIITLPLQEAKVSSTGKSLVIAGTNGFKGADLTHNGKAVSVSCNVITKL